MRPLHDSLKASLHRYLRQTHSRTTICVISPVITLIRVKSALARRRETLLQKLTAMNSRPFSRIAQKIISACYNEAINLPETFSTDRDGPLYC